jgi:hypothetical protein
MAARQAIDHDDGPFTPYKHAVHTCIACCAAHGVVLASRAVIDAAHTQRLLKSILSPIVQLPGCCYLRRQRATAACTCPGLVAFEAAVCGCFLAAQVHRWRSTAKLGLRELTAATSETDHRAATCVRQAWVIGPDDVEVSVHGRFSTSARNLSHLLALLLGAAQLDRLQTPANLN